MKWSTLLPTESIGIRLTADQVVPSVEVDITMSLAVPPGSKRRSCHTTNTSPSPLISAEGRAEVRKPPELAWVVRKEISTDASQDAPPLWDVKDRMSLLPTITPFTRIRMPSKGT